MTADFFFMNAICALFCVKDQCWLAFVPVAGKEMRPGQRWCIMLLACLCVFV